MGKDDIITLRISALFLERTIFIIIICILIILLLFNPLRDKISCDSSSESESSVDDNEKSGTETSSLQGLSVREEPAPKAEEEKKEETKETTTTNEEPKAEEDDSNDNTSTSSSTSSSTTTSTSTTKKTECIKIADGTNVELYIDKVDAEKKKTADPDFFWGKVNGIDYSITNGACPFIPLIEVYVYDDSSSEEEKLTPITKINFDLKIKEGYSTFSYDLTDLSVSFETSEGEKTVQLILKDKSNLNKTIKTLQKKFYIE